MQAILTMDGNTGGDFDKQDHSDHSNNLVGGLMAVLVVTVIVTVFVWMMKPATLPIRQVALPWVNDVSVHRVWPDGLRVIVNEQTAVVRWNGTGLLNDHGHYFSPEKDSFPRGLPLLEGPEESKELLLERFKLLKQTYGLPVVHLQMNQRRAWKFELKNGLSVVLGRRDFENRIERFVNVVINNLGEKSSQAREIDMRYTNGFAVRWKQPTTKHIKSGVK